MRSRIAHIFVVCFIIGSDIAWHAIVRAVDVAVVITDPFNVSLFVATVVLYHRVDEVGITAPAAAEKLLGFWIGRHLHNLAAVHVEAWEAFIFHYFNCAEPAMVAILRNYVCIFIIRRSLCGRPVPRDAYLWCTPGSSQREFASLNRAHPLARSESSPYYVQATQLLHAPRLPGEMSCSHVSDIPHRSFYTSPFLNPLLQRHTFSPALLRIHVTHLHQRPHRGKPRSLLPQICGIKIW